MPSCGFTGTAAVAALAVSVTVMLLALNMSKDLGGYGAGEKSLTAPAAARKMRRDVSVDREKC